MGSLQETKFYFENLFNTDWTATPVHYVGQEFKADGIDTWINPRYSPSGSKIGDISGYSTTVRGSLDVICWAKNDVDVFTLGDDVASFIGSTVDKSYKVTGYEVNDHAWHESNHVYLYLTFYVEFIYGTCAGPIVNCANSVGGPNGNEFLSAGTWYNYCDIFHN